MCRGEDLDVACEFPSFPLTDTFTRSEVPISVPAPDLCLCLCRTCGHAQLRAQVAPSVLYGDEYHFRTGASAVARSGTAFFLRTLDEVAPSRRFRHVFDIGCNDLHLLKQMDERSDLRTGIDPLWVGKEHNEDDGIRVIGSTIEDVDLASVLECPPDLIVCRHTLEHIWDPRNVLEQLMDIAADDTLFLFEVPGFESLLQRFRIDQVFHQHLQYFSAHSFYRLISEVSAQCLSHFSNFHDWGAMVVAFRKGHSSDTGQNAPVGSICTIDQFETVQKVFHGQMMATRQTLASLGEAVVYGYGASQMLPVLAYHLDTDMSALTAVLDDDPAKAGCRYASLPVEVMDAADVTDLEDSSVLITAVDNVKPILGKLLLKRPKRILYPLNVI